MPWLHDYLAIVHQVCNLDALSASRGRGGKTLRLNLIGYKLLAILAQKSLVVVQCEFLGNALWGDDLPESGGLRSHPRRPALAKFAENSCPHTFTASATA